MRIKDHIQKIREQVIAIKKKNKWSGPQAAVYMGVSVLTIFKFINDTGDVCLKTLETLECYLDDYNKS